MYQGWVLPIVGLKSLQILPSFNITSPEPPIIVNVQIWDNKNSRDTTSYIINPNIYIWVDNSCITSHGKARIYSMEILKPSFVLGGLLKVGMMWSPVGRHNSNTFKYGIRTDAYNICLFCAPISHGIKIYADNNNKKIFRTPNMIR